MYEGRKVSPPVQLIYYELGCAFGKTPTEIKEQMDPDDIMFYWSLHVTKQNIMNKQQKPQGKGR